MSQIWSLIRRHPIATIVLVVFAIIAASQPSGDSILGFVFIAVIVLALTWVVDQFKSRRRRTRNDVGQFVAQPTVKSVRKGRGTTSQINPPVEPIMDLYQQPPNQQTTDLAHREQQLQMQRDDDLRRREQDLATREADIHRRETGPFATLQQTSQMSPEQMATKTNSEQLTPVGHSAFVETAHRPIPVAPKRESSLITINHLLAMTPTEFEEFCVKALQGIGYTDVRRVGGAGDLTADIFGVDNMGRSTVVQCKRYKPGTKVGSPALQMFIGMKSVHHQAERGIYMTTADYSVPAVRLAKQHDIVLIDGDDLIKIAGLVLMPKSMPQVASGIARYCSNCGAEFTTDAKFCTSCGASRAA